MVLQYVKNCAICQITHTEKFKKPENLQIISKKSKKRYVIDITDLNNEIKFKYDDEKKKINSYEDIKNFIINKKMKCELIYQTKINNIIY